MLRQYKLKDYKFRLVLWVLILSVIGIMVIGSANGSYQMKQMIGMGVGIVFMIMVSLMDYLWISCLVCIRKCLLMPARTI